MLKMRLGLVWFVECESSLKVVGDFTRARKVPKKKTHYNRRLVPKGSCRGATLSVDVQLEVCPIKNDGPSPTSTFQRCLSHKVVLSSVLDLHHLSYIFGFLFAAGHAGNFNAKKFYRASIILTRDMTLPYSGGQPVPNAKQLHL